MSKLYITLEIVIVAFIVLIVATVASAQSSHNFTGPSRGEIIHTSAVLQVLEQSAPADPTPTRSRSMKRTWSGAAMTGVGVLWLGSLQKETTTVCLGTLGCASDSNYPVAELAASSALIGVGVLLMTIWSDVPDTVPSPSLQHGGVGAIWNFDW